MIGKTIAKASLPSDRQAPRFDPDFQFVKSKTWHLRADQKRVRRFGQINMRYVKRKSPIRPE
jgi:hypothetical protein